jgi:hypothetical protein
MNWQIKKHISIQGVVHTLWETVEEYPDNPHPRSYYLCRPPERAPTEEQRGYISVRRALRVARLVAKERR